MATRRWIGGLRWHARTSWSRPTWGMRNACRKPWHACRGFATVILRQVAVNLSEAKDRALRLPPRREILRLAQDDIGCSSGQASVPVRTVEHHESRQKAGSHLCRADTSTAEDGTVPDFRGIAYPFLGSSAAPINSRRARRRGARARRSRAGRGACASCARDKARARSCASSRSLSGAGAPARATAD